MRVPSTEMQNHFGKYLKFAEAQEEVIITKNGKEIAKLTACSGVDRSLIKEEASIYGENGDGGQGSSGNRVTYEEFLELTKASEQRYELIDGILYNLAAPSYQHQHVVHELHGTFYNWFRGKSCTPLTSPLDITLEKDRQNICVVQPDLVVICDRDQVDANGKYRGTPELVAEVLSSSTRRKDLIQKLDLYRQCGVKEYWIIDPMKAQVIVYTLADQEIADLTVYSNSGDALVLSQLFRGLSVSTQELFALF